MLILSISRTDAAPSLELNHDVRFHDEDSKAYNILADIPENVMDLYRDKPAAEGGALYGLPPDSNCQLQ